MKGRRGLGKHVYTELGGVDEKWEVEAVMDEQAPVKPWQERPTSLAFPESHLLFWALASCMAFLSAFIPMI